MVKKRKRRFIQVGVGGFGDVWVQRLAKHPGIELAGLVDVDSGMLDRAGAAYGIPAAGRFTSLDKALRALRPDAGVCVTPPAYHRRALVKMMKAGLDVITEKPLAGTPADCRAIMKTAQETGRTCAVSQNYRYRPATWTLAQLVKKGVIGEVGQVKVDFYLGMDFKGGFRHTMDDPLLVDMSIHHFDLIRFITGQDAASVRGESWNPSWSNYAGNCSSSVVFRMNGDARVLYNASWCAKGQFADWNGNWQIEGSKGTLVYRDGRIVLYKAPKLYTVTHTKEVPLKQPPQTDQDFVLKEFLACIRNGKRPGTDVFDNINSVGMVFGAVKAVRSSRTVNI